MSKSVYISMVLFLLFLEIERDVMSVYLGKEGPVLELLFVLCDSDHQQTPCRVKYVEVFVIIDSLCGTLCQCVSHYYNKVATN